MLSMFDKKCTSCMSRRGKNIRSRKRQKAFIFYLQNGHKIQSKNIFSTNLKGIRFWILHLRSPWEMPSIIGTDSKRVKIQISTAV